MRQILSEETAGDWTMRFGIMTPLSAANQTVSYFVDLLNKGSLKSRIGYSGLHSAQDEFLKRLREDALLWIADWEMRAHTGSTDFSDLS